MTSRVPIRWRLTFWQILLLTAALLLFGAALYFGLRRSLYEHFEEQVRNEAAFALAGVTYRGNQLSLSPDVLAQLEGDDHFVRLVGSGGAVALDTSEELGGIPIDNDQVTRALSGTPSFAIYSGADEPIGIATIPIVSAEETIGVLQVGTTRGDTDEVLQLIVIAMAIAGPLVFTVAAAGGYFLAGRALKPVDSITSLAAELDANDLTQRLDLDLPDDELGRLAATFDAMLARIEAAFEQQRRFTSDAAHELRTPLAAMRGEIDVALTRPRSNDELQQALKYLGSDVERISELVATLLTLSRGDAGHLQAETEPVNLATLVAATLDHFREEADSAAITLVDESTPVMCRVDGDLVVQLLINLMSNALAHTPPEGRITAGCRDWDGQVRLWVEDTGEGIPHEHQAKVFDRFYRIDTGRTRDRGGVGLGLSIVRQIVDLHGGTINLTSTPGAGTRIEATFPCGDSVDSVPSG